MSNKHHDQSDSWYTSRETRVRMFEPLTLRSVVFPNRLVLPAAEVPGALCSQPGDNALVRLGARAHGGAGAVVGGPLSVTPTSSIGDGSMLDSAGFAALQRTAAFVSSHGCVPALQLLADHTAATPTVDDSLLELDELHRVIAGFGQWTTVAREAGFKALELRADQGLLGYFLHMKRARFRLSNYGGTFYNRIRLLLEVLDSVRAYWPAELPLLVRLCLRGRPDTGWSNREILKLAGVLGGRGDIDMIVCRLSERADPAATSYLQSVRAIGRLPLGLLTGNHSVVAAEKLLRDRQGDLLFNFALEDDPYWPRRAARKLKVSTL